MQIVLEVALSPYEAWKVRPRKVAHRASALL